MIKMGRRGSGDGVGDQLRRLGDPIAMIFCPQLTASLTVQISQRRDNRSRETVLPTATIFDSQVFLNLLFDENDLVMLILIQPGQQLDRRAIALKSVQLVGCAAYRAASLRMPFRSATQLLNFRSRDGSIRKRNPRCSIRKRNPR